MSNQVIETSESSAVQDVDLVLPTEIAKYEKHISNDLFPKSSWIYRKSSSELTLNSSSNETVSGKQSLILGTTEATRHRPTFLSAPESVVLPSVLDKNCRRTDYTHEDITHDQVLLSICWSSDRLGAAFFDINTRQIYLMEDKFETAPDFWVLKTLFKELKPRILIVGGRQDSRLYSLIQELCEDGKKISMTGSGLQNKKDISLDDGLLREFASDVNLTESHLDDNNSVVSLSSLSSAPSASLFLLPSSDFKYEFCKRQILLYPWPGLTKDSSDNEKVAWIKSRVNFEAITAIRAFGGLLRFLAQKGSEFLYEDSLFSSTLILGLQSYIMEDLVHVDEATILNLQVFSEDLHPALVKNGKSSASKEGLSLFAILSRMASPLSSKLLRQILYRPLRDPEVLKFRYDFIWWALQPVNFDTVKSFQLLLKNISSIQMLFSRLQRSQLNVRDWKTLYKCIYNTVLVAELCKVQDQNIQAFQQVCECTSEGLYHSSYLIQRTLDFEQADREGRFVVKPGLDSELDEKKRRFHCLGDIMQKVAEIELSNLPLEIDSCCVIYLPHVGYLLAIPPSDVLSSYSRITSTVDFSNENCCYDIPGLQFRFSTADMVLFKSQLCEELDTEVGDLQVDIANRETSIMIRLIEEILRQSQSFLSLINKVLMIDVLLSFSLVARDFGWVRPTLNDEDSFIIKNGRHPIYELCNPTYVSNDAIGIRKNSPVILITGPNASGKTVYIKQVGVIAYLAHLGSFVPADYLSFSPFDAIVMVSSTTPSVTSGLSTFMLELNKMAQALSRSTSKSLVLIDEFGVSTCEYDGASLLLATINFWVSQNEPNESCLVQAEEKKGCPLVFISTHFLQIYDNLSPSLKPWVKNLIMDTVQEGKNVIPLFQVSEGSAKNSCALQVAQSKGLPCQTVERSRQVGAFLKQKCLPPRWNLIYNEREKKRCNEIVSHFLSHNINTDSVPLLLSSIRQRLNESSIDSLSITRVNLSTICSSVIPDTEVSTASN